MSKRYALHRLMINGGQLLLILSIFFATLLFGIEFVHKVYISKKFVSASEYWGACYDCKNHTFTWNGIVGMPREFSAKIKTNTAGWNDREHTVEDISKFNRRIAILGDSFVEALQVDSDKNFGRILERTLPSTMVSMIGKSGWGQIGELKALKEFEKIKPTDLIISFFYHNDVWNNSPTLAAALNPPGLQTLLWNHPMRDRIRSHDSWAFIASLIDGFRSAKARKKAGISDYDLYLEEADQRPEWKEGWKATREAFIKLRDDIAIRFPQARMYVLLMPSKEVIFNALGDSNRLHREDALRPSKKYQWNLPAVRSKQMLSELRGVHIIDPLDYIDRLNCGIPHFEADQHLNICGHRWMSVVILNELAKLGPVR